MLKVTCAIIDIEGEVLCAQRSKDMDLPLKWELPGGKIEEGETAQECLVREIKEELGIHISVGEQLPAFQHKYPNLKTIELLPFICKIKNGRIILKEHQQVKWLGKNELLSLDWAEADIPIVNFYIKNHYDH
jgi:8-oxo-dGTP diphosphatase